LVAVSRPWHAGSVQFADPADARRAQRITVPPAVHLEREDLQVANRLTVMDFVDRRGPGALYCGGEVLFAVMGVEYQSTK
jgi:hypothetical protein